MPRTTVLCLGPAGLGPSFFATGPGDSRYSRSAGLDSWPREALSELGQQDITGLLAVIVPEVLPTALAADRVVAFGHCFGAIIAYELCRALSAADPGLKLMLVASGSTRPGVPRGGQLSGLPDEEFIAGFEALAGYSYPALAT